MPAADFVALATLLLRPPAPPAAAAPPEIATETNEEPMLLEPAESLPEEVRRFRAMVRDAVEVRAAALLRELAADVLGRELRAAPVDLAATIDRVVRERRADEPLRARISRADAGVPLPLPFVVDDTLRAGDLILECRCGSIDARFGTRLAAVLERA